MVICSQRKMGLLRLRSIILLSGLFVCLLKPTSSQEFAITPTDVILFPGDTSAVFACQTSPPIAVSWDINNMTFRLDQIFGGALPGHNVSGTNITVSVPVNGTKYVCVIPGIPPNPTIMSEPVFLYIAAAPAMVGNIMIDLTTVDVDNDNVSFTLNWDEPFDNFDPIVNYTITINCNNATLCPVMFSTDNITTTADINFITNLSMMTPLSVTATNTIGPSIATTIMIAVPGNVSMVSLACGAVDLINQCNVTWNALGNDSDPPITYNVSHFVESSDNISGLVTVNIPNATIDLPAVNGDVSVFVTAMNVFGSGPPSNIVLDEILASSVKNTTSVIVNPNDRMELYSVAITCLINPTSTAEYCEVVASSSTAITSSAMIMNNDATVTINGLKCQETYVITAAGTNNSMLVGPRFRQKVNVTAGLCPTTSVVTTSTSTVTTTTVVTTTTTTTTNGVVNQSPGPSTSDDDNTGPIVGGVVGGIVAAIIIIIIIIILVWFCMKREKSSRPTSPGDKVAFRPASGVKVQTLDRYGKPVVDGDNADTGVELTVTSTGQPTTFQSNEYQTVQSDEKNRTPSAFMPEGSYDTLAPADEPPAPSAQVIPPAQNGQSNPNAPKLNYAELEQFTRKPASVKKPEPQPSSQYAVIDPKSLQGTYT